ncbi:hypothetical protein MIMGU_mgv1a015523mg [Erythranthe guttata]|uniref:Uncharacterized protein n=1 Tax=Erythranthe guttata TaxID=4155 RepID=A0A022QF39_ERYGU|nr:hypothetical protein MIMGU_mgv1a015523mg [Erythranthe guttata]
MNRMCNELNEVLTRELAEDGYSGVEVRATTVRATRTQNLLAGEKWRRIRDLTSLVQKRFRFPENRVELYAENKSMKFKDEYIDAVVRHVLLRQGSFSFGVLGIEAKVMLDWDPRGKQGLTTPLPEVVNIHPPKEEEIYIRPSTATTVPAEIDVQA